MAEDVGVAMTRVGWTAVAGDVERSSLRTAKRKGGGRRDSRWWLSK